MEELPDFKYFSMYQKHGYTKYEKARIIAARALQLAYGAKPLVEAQTKDPIKLAMLEWEKGVIPIDVKYPDARRNRRDQAKKGSE